MKNIHILPTDNSSTLSIDKGKLILHRPQWRKGTQYMYITSDEEIKEGDWFVHTSYDSTSIQKAIEVFNHILDNKGMISHKENNSKIILTTDQDLIKDGVKEIDDDFLNWFVKNPSCEEVEVEKVECQMWSLIGCNKDDVGCCRKPFKDYKIIIPKEEPKQDLPIVNGSYGCTIQTKKQEPKQETLEEAAEEYSEEYFNRDEIQMRCSKISFIDGYKLAQEQILDFLHLEITERRDYSASKMCEVIAEFIKNK